MPRHTKASTPTKRKRSQAVEQNDSPPAKRQRAVKKSSPSSAETKHQYLQPTIVSSVESWIENNPPNDKNEHKQWVSDGIDERNILNGKRSRKLSPKAQKVLSMSNLEPISQKTSPNLTLDIPVTPPASAVDIGGYYDEGISPSVTRATRSSGRCRNIDYRLELNRHGTKMDFLRDNVPAQVTERVDEILRKGRSSSGPSEQEMAHFEETVKELVEAYEFDTQYRMMAETSLFPKPQLYNQESQRLHRNVNIPFNRTTLPNNPEELPPLPVIRPDAIYGYPLMAITNALRPTDSRSLWQLLRSRSLNFANPSHDRTYWPYLIIEFQAYCDSSMWTAENQNSGTSASCVTSVERMLKLAYPEAQRNAADSMVFSCVVNALEAILTVHWFEPVPSSGCTPHRNVELERYRFANPQAAIDFRAHLQNITDWALGDRFTMIKDALVKFAVLNGTIEEAFADPVRKARGEEVDNTKSAEQPMVPSLPEVVIHEDSPAEIEQQLREGDDKENQLPSIVERRQNITVGENIVDAVALPTPWTTRLQKALQVCGQLVEMFA